MIRFYTSFITIRILNTLVFGQELDSIAVKSSSKVSMVTNRPGFTESTRAVFKSGFQIETGFQYSKEVYLGAGSENWESIIFPNLGLLYGISKNVEIRVFANYEGNKFGNLNYNQAYVYGVNGLNLGTKINLTQANGVIPEMALLITQGIPTTYFNAKVWSTSALLAWSYTLKPTLGLSGNLSFTRDSEFEEYFDIVNQNSIGYTVNLGYSITDKLSGVVEVFGNNRLNNNREFDVNFTGGLGYRITPKFQIDALAGYRVETAGFLVNAGFSWLILKE